MLIDLKEADMAAAGEKSAPRGTLTVTAPVAAGEDIMRPILGAYMDAFPAVSVRLYLLDRPANLIDEGIDVALRIAHLADSRLVAVGVGQVRRVLLPGEEHEPLPVHLVSPQGRLSVPKVRAFVDFALPRLRASFAGLEHAEQPKHPDT